MNDEAGEVKSTRDGAAYRAGVQEELKRRAQRPTIGRC
jgi:hypothetical protein